MVNRIAQNYFLHVIIFATLIWKDLVKTALIGTDKTNPSVSTLQTLENLGINSEDITEAVLQGAGTLTMLKKGGYPLQNFEDEMPQSCDKETKSYCTPKSAQHLREILRGAFEPALMEFLYYAERNNFIIPPEYLPELFPIAVKDKKMPAFLSGVIGNRGVWLAQQNSDWSIFLKENQDKEAGFSPLSKDDTLKNAKEIIELVKAISLVWAEDKKVNTELITFTYKADVALRENLDFMFSNTLPFSYQNKINDMVKILHFREKMVSEFKNRNH